jgi:hypothetical protein
MELRFLLSLVYLISYDEDPVELLAVVCNIMIDRIRYRQMRFRSRLGGGVITFKNHMKEKTGNTMDQSDFQVLRCN